MKVHTPAETPVLRAQAIPPTVVLREVRPRVVQAETNQGWLLDMGQMITGWFAFAGQVDTVSYMQTAEGGMASTDLADPDAGGRVRFCNKFNYHTFRYVRIQG